MDKETKNRLTDKAQSYEAVPDSYYKKTGSTSVFALEVSECTEFAYLGIKKGCMLYFDTETPFEEGQVSAFFRCNDSSVQHDFKMSRTKLEGWEYAGRLAFMFTPLMEVMCNADAGKNI